jgi:hypothetical protein
VETHLVVVVEGFLRMPGATGSFEVSAEKKKWSSAMSKAVHGQEDKRN